MPSIHPTAVVERGAQLAEGVQVGPFCYVGPKVTIGEGTRLLAHATVIGRTSVGRHNTLWPQVVLGGAPQDLKYRGEDSELIIGDGNEIREAVTMHLGTHADRGVTRVGNQNLIMAGAHVAHDCEIGDHTVIANIAQLAGHVTIESYARLAGACALHHFVTVGRFAFVGGMTRIVSDVPPYMTVEGNPSKVRNVNQKLLERSNFNKESIDALKEARRILFRANSGGGASGGRNGSEDNGVSNAETPSSSTAENLEYLRQRYPNQECIEVLVEFILRKMHAVHGRNREEKERARDQ